MSMESPPRSYAPTGLRAGAAGWRLIPEIDRDPDLVAGVQRLPGRILLCCVVVLLVTLLGFVGIDFSAALLAMICAYAGPYRRFLILLATLWMLSRSGFLLDTSFLDSLAAQEGLAGRINQPLLHSAALTLVVTLACGLLVLQHTRSTALRRPTLCLLLGFLGLVLISESTFVSGLPRVLVWWFLMTCQPYLWFFAYALADAGKQRWPVWQQFSVFHPFWGATLTPFGKGLSYLERFEARTAEELAVTQLKGIKLAAWTLLLALGQACFHRLVYGTLQLPAFDVTFLRYLAHDPYPRWMDWSSLIAFFIEDLLSMTVFGGVIVAAARLAGFRLLRNTYRPLESRTLAEFWNRYYFYYKELLVDHFFYPTFVSCFRGYRRLRMFFATFVAACVGNLLFHFIRDIHFVAEMGLWRAVVGEQSHAFYTFVLATSVGLSQLRRAPKPIAGGSFLRDRLLPCLWVSGFFCIIHVFDAPLDREHSLWQRAGYLLYLLGVTS